MQCDFSDCLLRWGDQGVGERAGRHWPNSYPQRRTRSSGGVGQSEPPLKQEMSKTTKEALTSQTAQTPGSDRATRTEGM